MSKTSNDEISRLLGAAAKAIADAPLCWLAMGGGAIHARPMGFDAKDFERWQLSFITDSRSGKAAALHASGRATVLIQIGGENFVASSGVVTFCENPAEVARRWKRGYDAFFPSESDRANAIFVDLVVDRLDLWIRGVTSEPFGMATTSLTRAPGGDWRLLGQDTAP